MAALNTVDTPALLLDPGILAANAARMAERARGLGVGLRPHLKTAKSIAVAKQVVAAGPLVGITVSTAREAEYFAQDGDLMAAVGGDIFYAVTVPEHRFARLAKLASERKVEITIGVDSFEGAQALAEHVRSGGAQGLRALIEVDSGEHRSGVQPGDSERLVELGRMLGACGALRGVFTHAGHSYSARGAAALVATAEAERAAVVSAAATLRAAGCDVEVVSAGSTPTACYSESAAGLTEYRAGVYVFGDMFMVGLGVCGVGDVAASVLTTIIGHQPRTGQLIVDAGGLALSKDRSTAAFDGSDDVGYGAIANLQGRRIPDLQVVNAYQEHGMVASTSGSMEFERFPIGSRLRVLPNHACMTCSAYDSYAVCDGDRVVEAWPRIHEWC